MLSTYVHNLKTSNVKVNNIKNVQLERMDCCFKSPIWLAKGLLFRRWMVLDGSDVLIVFILRYKCMSTVHLFIFVKKWFKACTMGMHSLRCNEMTTMGTFKPLQNLIDFAILYLSNFFLIKWQFSKNIRASPSYLVA